VTEDIFRILYVDGGEESRQAQELLDKEGVQYGELPHNPHHFWSAKNTAIPAPVLVAPEGRFRGIEAIARFASFYSSCGRDSRLR
jgi:hypothetical protein